MQGVARAMTTQYARLGCTAICWALALAVGGWLMTQMRPFQSPDEGTHIGRVYLLSQGQWLLASPTAFGRQGFEDTSFVGFNGELVTGGLPPRMSGGWVDDALVAYGRHHVFSDGRPSTADARAAEEALGATGWNPRRKTFVELAGTGYYAPLAYLPHAAALRLGSALGGSVATTYQLTRAWTFVLSMLVVAWAFAIWAPPAGVLALLLLPATIYQALNPTLDGFTTACFVLALALFARAWQSGRRLSRTSMLIFGVCLALVVGTRLQMLPALALPLALAWRTRSKGCLGLAVLLAVAVLAWIAFAVATTVDTRVLRPHGTIHYLTHYLSRPDEFFGLLAATLGDPTMLRFYASTFIGKLGSADVNLPIWTYPVIGLLLVVALASSASRVVDAPDGVLRVALAGTALLCVLLTFLALLAGWTPHPAQRIEGVQGRYLLMPALLAAVALSGTQTQRKGSRWWGYGACAALASTATVAIALVLSAN